MTLRFLRLPAVLSLRQRSRSAHYTDVADGLATRPVRIGLRAVATPQHEIEAINAARLAGADDNQIRELVEALHASRKTDTFHNSGDHAVPITSTDGKAQRITRRGGLRDA